MFSAVGLGGGGKLLQQNSHQKKPSPSSSAQAHFELLSLPPNVNGRRRGTLEVRLSGIRWTSGKSYPLVEIRLSWWGQQQQQRRSLLHWKQGGKNVSESERLLRYEVLTSEDLFRKYLKAAEPVQVRLVSSRTGSLIGTATVPVPGKLVNFRVGEEVTGAGRAEIASGSGFGLGEISLEFVLRFDQALREDKENGTAGMVQRVKKPLPVVLPERASDLAVKGVSVSLHEGKQVSWDALLLIANVKSIPFHRRKPSAHWTTHRARMCSTIYRGRCFPVPRTKRSAKYVPSRRRKV